MQGIMKLGSDLMLSRVALLSWNNVSRVPDTNRLIVDNLRDLLKVSRKSAKDRQWPHRAARGEGGQSHKPTVPADPKRGTWRLACTSSRPSAELLSR
jgi:hypothetical protein